MRDPAFEKFLPIYSASDNSNDYGIFSVKSRGLESARDPWVYNFSYRQLKCKAKETIDFYNNEVDRLLKKTISDDEITLESVS